MALGEELLLEALKSEHDGRPPPSLSWPATLHAEGAVVLLHIPFSAAIDVLLGRTPSPTPGDVAADSAPSDTSEPATSSPGGLDQPIVSPAVLKAALALQPSLVSPPFRDTSFKLDEVSVVRELGRGQMGRVFLVERFDESHEVRAAHKPASAPF